MRSLTDDGLAAIKQTVEYNCAISDARYARDYSLCIYLLRMREYYRWQHQLPLTQELSVELVGDWVSQTEEYWDEIEDNNFLPLTVHGRDYDPFDHQSINQQLSGSGFVYSAGIGRLGQPHFAIATLLRKSSHQKLELFHCGKELVRDIVTIPAMSQGTCVFIRHDGIFRHLWDLYDDWNLHRKPGPMARLVKYYALERNESLERSLRAISEDFAGVIEMHEHGEVAASAQLGPEYSELTVQMAGTRDELYLRTVRDMLADALRTWPYIIQENNALLLDFYLAGLNGLRLDLLEQLGLYEPMSFGGDSQRLLFLENNLDVEYRRWLELCLKIKDSCQMRLVNNCAHSTSKELVDAWVLSQTKKAV